MKNLKTSFTEQAGVQYPIICGAMYPCSNPELVAAVSEAGGLGIVQPISLVYVHGYDYRAGLRYLRQLTSKPYGLNVIVERSSRLYEKRMQAWVDIALEEGCRFFITALGNPTWVVKKVKAAGGYVYHDVTDKRWALKALDNGVDGLNCVNNRAGGHAGTLSPQEMWEQLHDLGVPLICAGGVGDAPDFILALELGYAGVQMGTRFIATMNALKRIITSRRSSTRMNPISCSRNESRGFRSPSFAPPMSNTSAPMSVRFRRWLLRHRWSKPWMRMWYALTSVRRFKQITLYGGSSKDYWQAGKSVAGIHAVEHAGDIIKRFVDAVQS